MRILLIIHCFCDVNIKQKTLSWICATSVQILEKILWFASISQEIR